MAASYNNELDHVHVLLQDNPESDMEPQEYQNMIVESIYYSELAISYDNERETHDQ
ncbi:MAG: hypothetical protein M8364_19920 [Methylobacter sp.]|uniref:hypothetical protein n=1 Tax=Methylobacter TaxID=429 RepID=UPI000377F2FC|nr:MULTISPECIES: hypothetical protein [Methylobacter]MCL7423159.1 hypothetical protein [Methylobacter sp.]